MADHGAYHSLGKQEDPANLRPRAQPATPQFRPPAAPTPTGYHQGSSYGSSMPQPQQQYGGTPQPVYQHQGMPSQEQGYFPPQQSPASPYDGAMGGLSSQMGSMGLGQDGSGPARPNKKKHRHAYHNLDQPVGSSQAFNGIPQGEVNPSQYLGTSQPQPISQAYPYGDHNITPAMNQFPALGGAPYTPGGTPAAHGPASSLPVPSGPSVSGQGRVDPEQIPSVPRSRDVPAQYYLDHIYHTMEQHLPPPGPIPFIAYDQGNSSPKFARLTLNNIPSSSEALSATALPLGLLLQPLAPLALGEQPISVLDFGEPGPPRCRRCRTYINPFMMFRSGGNKFVCNMCTFPNDVPPEYFAPTDPSGVRVDREQRPELRLGTVEFMVPKEYWAKEPVGLRWLFVIDVGQEAINRGFLDAFCDGILGALYGKDHAKAEEEQNGDTPETARSLPLGSKVGFVTFDKDIHFYNCNVSFSVTGIATGVDSVRRRVLSNHKCS